MNEVYRYGQRNTTGRVMFIAVILHPHTKDHRARLLQLLPLVKDTLPCLEVQPCTNTLDTDVCRSRLSLMPSWRCL